MERPKKMFVYLPLSPLRRYRIVANIARDIAPCGMKGISEPVPFIRPFDTHTPHIPFSELQTEICCGSVTEQHAQGNA
jgi:hypothetical protein